MLGITKKITSILPNTNNLHNGSLPYTFYKPCLSIQKVYNNGNI